MKYCYTLTILAIIILALFITGATASTDTESSLSEYERQSLIKWFESSVVDEFDLTVNNTDSNTNLLSINQPLVPIPYTKCGAAGDLFTFTDLSADIWPPNTGKNLTFNIAGTLSTPVKSGELSIQLTFAGFPVYTKTSTFKFPISIPAGSFNLKRTITVWNIWPVPGRQLLGFKFMASNSAGTEITCFAIQMF